MDHEKDYRKDELLEVLWHLNECHDLTLSSFREHDPAKALESDLHEFSSNGILKFDGKNIEMTKHGESLARGIVRRHRLAERLLTDVLGKTPEETEKAACEFEHILAPELVESICILLGHPQTCPHGAIIPKGDCCLESKTIVSSMVTSVSKMEAGQEAKVVSINTDDPARMNKLLAIGIIPGVTIRLQQKNPALVLEVNRTQIAIEDVIGEGINVWRSNL